MKLTISKSELQKGLTRIQSVVEKRNTMPILANVLLDASNKKSKTLTSGRHRSRSWNSWISSRKY